MVTQPGQLNYQFYDKNDNYIVLLLQIMKYKTTFLLLNLSN